MAGFFVSLPYENKALFDRVFRVLGKHVNVTSEFESDTHGNLTPIILERAFQLKEEDQALVVDNVVVDVRSHIQVLIIPSPFSGGCSRLGRWRYLRRSNGLR